MTIIFRSYSSDGVGRRLPYGALDGSRGSARKLSGEFEIALGRSPFHLCRVWL
jgi:hypothetical protein